MKNRSLAALLRENSHCCSTVMTNVDITKNEEHELHSEHLVAHFSMVGLTFIQSNESGFVF
jgi:hypothetical protein